MNKEKYHLLWSYLTLIFSRLIAHICVFQRLYFTLSGETPCRQGSRFPSNSSLKQPLILRHPVSRLYRTEFNFDNNVIYGETVMCFAQDVKALSDVIYHMVEAFHHSLFFSSSTGLGGPLKKVCNFSRQQFPLTCKPQIASENQTNFGKNITIEFLQTLYIFFINKAHFIKPCIKSELQHYRRS